MEVIATVLDHLRRPDRRCVQLAWQMREQPPQRIDRDRRAGADDRVRGRVEIADRRALAQEFRLEAEMKIDAVALARFAFHDRAQRIFHRARDERRAKYEDV